MELPDFVLRKLYERGSLRETTPGHFQFALRNPLASATLVAPPRITVNGIAYAAATVHAGTDLAAISPERPLRFAKGDRIELTLPGSLLRGGNQVHVTVQTKEFGELRIEAEDRSAAFCDLPGAASARPAGERAERGESTSQAR